MLPAAHAPLDLIYRHDGSTSFQHDSRLAECWRDLRVVGQTVTGWYPIGGRVHLGIDPARALIVTASNGRPIGQPA